MSLSSTSSPTRNLRTALERHPAMARGAAWTDRRHCIDRQHSPLRPSIACARAEARERAETLFRASFPGTGRHMRSDGAHLGRSKWYPSDGTIRRSIEAARRARRLSRRCGGDRLGERRLRWSVLPKYAQPAQLTEPSDRTVGMGSARSSIEMHSSNRTCHSLYEDARGSRCVWRVGGGNGRKRGRRTCRDPLGEGSVRARVHLTIGLFGKHHRRGRLRVIPLHLRKACWTTRSTNRPELRVSGLDLALATGWPGEETYERLPSLALQGTQTRRCVMPRSMRSASTYGSRGTSARAGARQAREREARIRPCVGVSLPSPAPRPHPGEALARSRSRRRARRAGKYPRTRSSSRSARRAASERRTGSHPARADGTP